MPRFFLNDALTAQTSTWLQSAPHGDFDDACLWQAGKLRLARKHYLSSFKEVEKEMHPADGEMLEYQADNGETILLSKESEAACVKDCEHSPALKGNDGVGESKSSFAAGGEEQMVAGCVSFCNEKLGLCFPASATVAVRDKGRMPMSKLHVGDNILVARPSATADDSQSREHQELAYEPIIAWLHYEPDMDVDVVKVTHKLGVISLTPDHMLFVRRKGETSIKSVAAQKVSIGDRVLSPWIDGGFSEPEVTAVCQERASGAFCPLTPSGTLLVDSTVASCYAIPSEITDNVLYSSLLVAWKRSGQRNDAHDLAHMTFLPIRLLHQARSTVVAAKEKQLEEQICPQHTCGESKEAPELAHPYGRFMESWYMLAKSITV